MSQILFNPSICPANLSCSEAGNAPKGSGAVGLSVRVYCQGNRMPRGTVDKRIEVFTYSGYKADERPQYFLLRGRRLEVETIIERWYEPDEECFRVRASDGLPYVLKRKKVSDEWLLGEGPH